MVRQGEKVAAQDHGQSGACIDPDNIGPCQRILQNILYDDAGQSQSASRQDAGSCPGDPDMEQDILMD